MQSGDQPAVLPLGKELAVRQTKVGLDLRDGEQRRPLPIEDDRGDVMIEEDPFAFAVSAAGQQHFKGAVSVDADDAAAGMAEQAFHLRTPLGVRRPAQPKPEGKQPRPVFARPVIPVREALAPEVLSAVLRVIVVSVPP